MSSPESTFLRTWPGPPEPDGAHSSPDCEHPNEVPAICRCSSSCVCAVVGDCGLRVYVDPTAQMTAPQPAVPPSAPSTAGQKVIRVGSVWVLSGRPGSCKTEMDRVHGDWMFSIEHPMLNQSVLKSTTTWAIEDDALDEGFRALSLIDKLQELDVALDDSDAVDCCDCDDLNCDADHAMEGL